MAGRNPALSRVLARLAHCDDDALAALASKGLLRRAYRDLQVLSLGIPKENEGRVRVDTGEAVVEVSESLQDSTCTCPASGVCRHVLVVLLHLRSLGQEAPPVEPGSGQKEILALNDDTLARWAGKGLLRRSMKKLAGGPRFEMSGDNRVMLGFPELGITCHWLPGGGPDAMICTCRKPGPCEHKLMAILACQVASGGREIEEDPGTLEQARGVARGRTEVLGSVGEALRALVVHGTTRASRETMQRFQTLAVSAHGVDLPRLEHLLRSLAEEVSFHLSRGAQADTGALLAAAARIEALRCALAHPTPVLVGVHRSAYHEVGTMHLTGWGARQWRTRSGYTGLTVYFQHQETGAWVTWTDSRPPGRPGLDPAKRYLQYGPWEGCQSPLQACRSRLSLSRAFRNPGGRLSSRPATTATLIGPADPATGPEAARDWSKLAGEALRLFGESFRPWSEGDGLVVLHPTRWGDSEYDQVRQELVRPLYDTRDRVLPLVIPYTAETEMAVANLEGFQPGPAARVLGILRLADGRISVEPVSLHEGHEIVNLTLDRVLSKTLPSPGRSRQKHPGQDLITGAEEPGYSSSALGNLLSAVARELETRAEAGLALPSPSEELPRLAQQARAIGLECCHGSLSGFIELARRARKLAAGQEAAAGALLRAYYVTRLAAATDYILLAAADFS